MTLFVSDEVTVLSTSQRPSRRAAERGNTFVKVLLVLALAGAAFKYGPAYFGPKSELMIRNHTELPLEGLVVQIATPDAFDRFGQYAEPIVLGTLEGKDSVRTKLAVTGRAQVQVSYQANFKDYSAAHVLTLDNDLDLLLEVRRVGAHDFTEGNGVW